MTELKKISQVAWKRFLSTESGMEGMLHLRERVPTVQKGQPHEIQFDAGYAMGYLRALDIISEIIALQPAKEERIENDN